MRETPWYLFWIPVALFGICVALVFKKDRDCHVPRGADLIGVIHQCGTPDKIEQTVTGTGSIRTELTFGDRLVVLEDDSVLMYLE